MRYIVVEYINGGAVMWDDIKGEVEDYEKEKVNFALYTRGQYVEEVSSCMLISSI